MSKCLEQLIKGLLWMQYNLFN